MVAEQIIAHLKRSLAVRQRAAAAGAWAAPQAAWLALPWALEQYGADHWGWSMDLGKINVEVKRQRLIVTLEGTSYRAVFRLSPDKSRLIESGALLGRATSAQGWLAGIEPACPGSRPGA